MKHCAYIVLFFCLTVMSCRSGDNELLPADTMKVVMWDMLKIDELYSQMMIKDSALRHTRTNLRLYEEVFALHHITRAQFEKNYKFYESHPIEFKRLLDSIETHAERERTQPVIALPKNVKPFKK